MRMKKTLIAVLFGLVLMVAILGMIFSAEGEHEPKDLSYWMQAAAAKDWSEEAALGDPHAQFYMGLTLIRSNLVTMTDRVSILSALPVIGTHYTKVSYGIDDEISQEQLAEAHQWVKKSADQGFAPAKGAEWLFIGALGSSISSGITSKPLGVTTNGPL